MSKNVLIALAVISVICFGCSIFVWVVEPAAENIVIAALFLLASVFFCYQIAKTKTKNKK